VSDWFLGCKSTVPSLNAGLDMEMPQMFYYAPSRIRRAIRKGLVAESVIDEAVLRILRQKIRFGLLDDKFQRDKKMVACQDHTDLALESARKSMVLLKNDDSLLPLDKNTIKRIAVIGTLARKFNMGSKGSTGVTPPWVITALQGIKRTAGESIKVDYASGRSFNRKRALAMARRADAVIIVTGLTQKDEGEYFPIYGGGDRLSLELNRKDEDLIQDITALNSNCAVVLIGGSAICVDRWINDVKALIMAWYAGMQGGQAIADIIFGTVNPSGKLPITMPKTTDQLLTLDNRSDEIVYDYWHDYRYLDQHGLEPRFPFGFGLSYTTYRYSNLKLNKQEYTAAEKIEVSLDVENRGNEAGDEIVQIYVAYNGSAVERPKKELKAFKKVALKPGEKVTATLEIPVQDLAYYDETGKQWAVEKIKYEILAGPSSADLPLCDRFSVR
jgi:beta-glucosidase